MFAPSPPPALDIIPRVKRREIEEQTNKGAREKSLRSSYCGQTHLFPDSAAQISKDLAQKAAANFLACRHRLRRHGKFLDKQ
jgi:hypothetical protein